MFIGVKCENVTEMWVVQDEDGKQFLLKTQDFLTNFMYLNYYNK